MTFRRLFLIFAFGCSLVSCGPLSSVVTVEIDKQHTDPPPTPLSAESYAGLSSAAGVKKSGAFKFNGAIGSEVASAIKSDQGFIFYGSIQGQVISDDQ